MQLGTVLAVLLFLPHPAETEPPREIPDASDVSEIRVHGSRTGSLRLPESRLTEGDQITAVVNWLRGGVKWSAQPQDTRPLFLPTPIKVRFITKEGKYLDFSLIDGAIVLNTRSWPADTQRLQAIMSKFKK